MYLNHGSHSNPTLLQSRFRYFTVDFLISSKEVETPTITHEIFETNSSFDVKQCTTEKV